AHFPGVAGGGVSGSSVSRGGGCGTTAGPFASGGVGGTGAAGPAGNGAGGIIGPGGVGSFIGPDGGGISTGAVIFSGSAGGAAGSTGFALVGDGSVSTAFGSLLAGFTSGIGWSGIGIFAGTPDLLAGGSNLVPSRGAVLLLIGNSPWLIGASGIFT